MGGVVQKTAIVQKYWNAHGINKYSERAKEMNDKREVKLAATIKKLTTAFTEVKLVAEKAPKETLSPREAAKNKLIALIDEIEPFIFLKAKQYEDRYAHIQRNCSGDSKYYTTLEREQTLTTAYYKLKKPREKSIRPLDGSIKSIMRYAKELVSLNEFCDKAIEKTMAEPFLSQIRWGEYEARALNYSLVG